jgi:hypothetical protein
LRFAGFYGVLVQAQHPASLYQPAPHRQQLPPHYLPLFAVYAGLNDDDDKKRRAKKYLYPLRYFGAVAGWCWLLVSWCCFVCAIWWLSSGLTYGAAYYGRRGLLLRLIGGGGAFLSGVTAALIGSCHLLRDGEGEAQCYRKFQPHKWARSIPDFLCRRGTFCAGKTFCARPPSYGLCLKSNDL